MLSSRLARSLDSPDYSAHPRHVLRMPCHCKQLACQKHGKSDNQTRRNKAHQEKHHAFQLGLPRRLQRGTSAILSVGFNLKLNCACCAQLVRACVRKTCCRAHDQQTLNRLACNKVYCKAQRRGTGVLNRLCSSETHLLVQK